VALQDAGESVAEVVAENLRTRVAAGVVTATSMENRLTSKAIELDDTWIVPRAVCWRLWIP